MATGKWICPESDCRRTFRRKYHLTRHQDNKHAQARPHACHICSRSFARHDALIRHVRFHQRKVDAGAREKTFFACDRCHKRKVRCDNKTPCLPCQKYNAPCTRSGAAAAMDPDASYTSTPADEFNGSLTSPMTAATTQQHIEDLSLPTPSTSYEMSVNPSTFPNVSHNPKAIPPIKFASLEANDVPTPSIVNSLLIEPLTSTGYTPGQSVGAQSSHPGDYATEDEQTTYELYHAIAQQEQDPSYLVYRSTIDRIMRDECYQSYFSLLHPQWPILHHETFRRCLASAEVRYSIAFLGALLHESHTDLNELKALHQTVVTKVLEKITQQHHYPTPDPTGRSQLELAKALLLTILFAFYVQEKNLLSAALGHMATLVSWVRHIGFFNIEVIAAQDDPSGTEWSRWILREQKTRLVFSTFRLECELNLLHNLPPTIRFQELELPFMTTDGSWNACTSQEWEQAIAQEPQGRTSSAFSALCSLTLSQLSPSERLNLAGFFTTADFELGICSIQSRLWEETKQQPTATVSPLNNCQSSDVASLHGYGQGWPVVLEIWRVMMERFRPESKPYCEDDSEQMAYLTGMMIHHLSMLRAYADLSFLDRLAKHCLQDPQQGSGATPSATYFTRQYEIRLQQWTQSNTACDALWHAAQILDLAMQHIPSFRARKTIVLNPVVIDCLYRASLIAWAFCRSRMSCSLCAPLLSSTTTSSTLGLRVRSCPEPLSHRSDRCSDAIDRVELTRLPKHSEQYNSWIQVELGEGQKSSTFIGNILICACNVSRVVDMYEDMIRIATEQWCSVEFPLRTLQALKRNS